MSSGSGFALKRDRMFRIDERDDALPVRRAFVDRPSTKLRRDRLHILALCAREILHRVQSAEALEIGDHVFGDRPAIEGCRPFAANRFERVGKLGLTLHRADAWRFAVGQEGASRGRIEAQDVALLGDVVGDAWRDRISVARQSDRRLERRFERPAAMILDQPRPGLDRAGNGDGVRRMAIDRRHAMAFVPFRRRRDWRASRAVVGDDVGGAATRQLHEAVAANPRRTRFDHALDRAGRDGGVDRVAALA